jgi:Mg-chelatase subunit ChlD
MKDMPVSKRERGASLILFTMITAVVLIPIVGLAVDGSVLFWEKARLSASVDAAALATGRALNTAQALTTQLSAIEQIGQNYFLANFQPGQMGTSVVTPTANLVSVDASQLNVITVTVQATVSVPLYFMRLFGTPSASVSDTGKAQRRDLNVIFVIDRSGSMNTGTECSDLRNAITDSLNYFIDGRDTIGLITFQYSAALDWGPAKTFISGSPSMVSKVNQLYCYGATNSSMALSMAHSQITALNGQSKLNVVIFFTDGYPTALNIGSTADPVTIASSSSCNASDVLAGVVTMPGQSPNDSGPTYGLYVSTPMNISSSTDPSIAARTGCSFNTNSQNMWKDVAYLPAHDAYGNLTDNGYQPFGADSRIYNSGHLRSDYQSSVLYAAFNTADAAGQSIRTDSTYSPIIYTIGLGSSVDTDFLKRLANDPSYSNYNSSLSKGQYVYASDSSQLDSAFREIASMVLKLSQ